MHAVCVSNKAQLSYVKPHGALYNDMMKDVKIFEQVCQAISAFDTSLPLLMQAIPSAFPNAETFKTIALKYSITLLFEAFADREYTDEGLLVSRSEENAVIHDTDKIIARCKQLITQKQFTSIGGKTLTLKVDTLCVHGDNPAAIEVVKKLHHLLQTS
jgi:UPF0271 protein